MIKWENSPSTKTPINAENLNKMQQDIVDDMSKTYIGTNITANTVAGYGRINKIYAKPTEEGTGEKSIDNPYKIKCVGNINIFKGTQNKKNINTQYVGIVAGNFSIKKGETYTLSLDTTNNGGHVYINEEYFTLNDTTQMLCDGTRKKCTTTAKETGTYEDKVLIKTGRNTTETYNISNIKLEIGSVATAYSQHGYGIVQNTSKNTTNTSTHTTLVDKPLYAISDAVYDEINYTNKEIYYRCERVLLNGSQNLDHQEAAGGSYTRFDIALPTKPSSSAGISNKLKITSPGGTIEEKIGLSSEYQKAFLYLKNSRLETIDAEGLKKYLQANPIELIYHRPIQSVTNINFSNTITQYDNTTNIYNTEGAIIEVNLTNNKTISEINRKLKQIEQPTKLAKTYTLSCGIEITLTKVGTIVQINIGGTVSSITANTEYSIPIDLIYEPSTSYRNNIVFTEDDKKAYIYIENTTLTIRTKANMTNIYPRASCMYIAKN